MLSNKNLTLLALVVLLSLACVGEADFAGNQLYKGGRRARIPGGDQFIQLGNWRIGNFDNNHFCFTHKSGYTSVIYRSDGTVHGGPRPDYSLWKKPRLPRAKEVVFGDKYVQFGGQWRLAQINPQHLSLTHVSGNIAMIWRCDGTKHPGPRKDFNGFSIASQTPSEVRYGQNILQIGYWRIGQVDNSHMSIGTTMTSDIYRSDGTIHPGPRFDYNLADRDL